MLRTGPGRVHHLRYYSIMKKNTLLILGTILFCLINYEQGFTEYSSYHKVTTTITTTRRIVRSQPAASSRSCPVAVDNSGKSEMIGTGRYGNNCVLYLRNEIGIELPRKDLTSYASKLSIINSKAPITGEVAVIKIDKGAYRNIGHVAEVLSVETANNAAIIRLREANFPASGYYIRTIIGKNIEEAQKNANIVGYYQPV